MTRPRKPVMRDKLRQLVQIREEILLPWYLGLALLFFGLLFAVWSFLSYGGYVRTIFLPTPTNVAAGARAMAESGNLWIDIQASVTRVFSGFFFAALIAVPVGVLVGSFKAVEAFIEPFVAFVRYIPAIAFIPLVILWVGIGEAGKITVIFIGTFFQMLVLIADVTRNVSHHLIQVSYTLGASKREVLFRVIWRAALPGISGVLRITLGWAWTFLVAGELVAAQTGLGFRILKAQRFLLTNHIFVGMMVIGLLGLTSDYAFKLIHRRLFSWN